MRAFGAELRRRREEQGISLTKLATLVNYSKSHLSKVECGRKLPSVELARQCDRQLNADGALAKLAPARESPEPRPDADHEGEVWTMHLRTDGSGGFHALSENPSALFGGATMLSWPASGPQAGSPVPACPEGGATYERLLVELRHLGQASRPSAVLPITATVTSVLRTQADASSPADRSRLLLLAARFAEYTGWMAPDLGNDDA